MPYIVPFNITPLVDAVTSNDVQCLIKNTEGNTVGVFVFTSNEFYEKPGFVGQYEINLDRFATTIPVGQYTLVIEGLRPVVQNLIVSEVGGSRYEIKIDVNGNTVNHNDFAYAGLHELATINGSHPIINSRYESGYLFLKVVDELPSDVTENSQVEIHQRVFEPVELVVQVMPLIRNTTRYEYLPPANDPTDKIQVGEYSYAMLMGAEYSSSIEQKILDEMRHTRLNVDYSNFADHCYFASAESALETAYSRMRSLINYQSLINTAATTTSLNVMYSTYTTKQQDLINDMTNYDRYVYDYGWPRFATGNNGLYHYTSSTVTQWYATQSYSASIWDSQNDAQLWLHVPSYYFAHDDANEFYSFVHSLASNFDYIKQHIDQLINFINFNYDDIDMAPNNLLWLIGEYFGYKMRDANSLASLRRYLLGDETAASALRDMTHSLWLRILNNLPHVYKTKGTEEALRSMLNIYGIPADLLLIREPTLNDHGIDTASYETYYTPIKSTNYVKFTGGVSNGFYLNTTEASFGSQSISQSKTYESHIVLSPALSTSSTAFSVFNHGMASKFSVGLTVANLNTTPCLSLSIAFYTGGFARRFAMSVPNIPVNNHPIYAAAVFNPDQTCELTVTQINNGLTTFNTTSVAHLTAAAVVGPLSTTALTVGFSAGAYAGVMESRFWDRVLSVSERYRHAQDFKSIYLETPISSIGTVSERWNYIDLKGRYRFDEQVDLNAYPYACINTAPVPIGYSLATSFPVLPSPTSSNYYWGEFMDNTTTFVPSLSGRRYDRKIRVISGTIPPEIIDLPNVEVLWSPADAIDNDIIDTVADLDMNQILGNPTNSYNTENYPLLDIYRSHYFAKYVNAYDFYTFLTLVQQMDHSIREDFEQLIPARARLAYGALIRSHMFERNKYRRNRPAVNVEPNPYGITDYVTYAVKAAFSSIVTILDANQITTLASICPSLATDGTFAIDLDNTETYTAAVQPYVECKLIDSKPQDFMVPYFEIECATYRGTTNTTIDDHTPSAWVTGISFGEQISVN